MIVLLASLARLLCERIARLYVAMVLKIAEQTTGDGVALSSSVFLATFDFLQSPTRVRE